MRMASRADSCMSVRGLCSADTVVAPLCISAAPARRSYILESLEVRSCSIFTGCEVGMCVGFNVRKPSCPRILSCLGLASAA